MTLRILSENFYILRLVAPRSWFTQTLRSQVWVPLEVWIFC